MKICFRLQIGVRMNKKTRFAGMSKDEILVEINKMPQMFVYTESYLDPKGMSRIRVIRYEDKKILADWQSKSFVNRYRKFNVKYRNMGINPVMKLVK